MLAVRSVKIQVNIAHWKGEGKKVKGKTRKK
jgi:hypothetical protein